MNRYPTSHDTPHEYSSPPLAATAGAHVLERLECWRPSCRDQYRGYRTVTHLTDGRWVARCHGRIHDDLSYRVDVWKHGAAA